MFGIFNCKSLHYVKKAVQASLFHEPCFLQNYPSLLFPKCISSIPNEEEHSFAVNYLINSCGFSPESALSASKYIHLKTPQKPDAVLAFFKQHNFTQTQISNIIKRNPLVIIVSDPERTLLPTFNFFYSIGLSSVDLANILCSSPLILRRSLKNQIIPSFSFCKNLIQDNEKIIKAFKRNPNIFVSDIEKFAAPNMTILRDFGVPGSNILTLFSRNPRSFLLRSDYFREIVEEVKRMGFNPLKMHFLLAVSAMRSMNKLTWNRKLEVYKKWNLSEKEVLVAFGKSPWCMTTSEKKIMAVMDYFVNTMGWKALIILNRPCLLCLSLEKRIVPRCSVVQVLLSKGLIKEDFSLTALLESTEKLFLQKFVTCHEEIAPQLLKIYKEKFDVGMKGGLG